MSDAAHEPVRPVTQLRTSPPAPPAGTVEERVARWAEMLDDAVSLLNQVMTEVKEAGKDTAEDAH